MIKYLIIFLFLGLANIGALNVGDKAPDFLVRTGDKKELTLKDCERKIVVMFYETKDNKEENRRLKDSDFIEVKKIIENLLKKNAGL